MSGLPANWNTVPVTGTYLDGNGDPCTGEILFTSPTDIVVGGTTVVPRVITAALDADGTIAVNLPATNDPDLDDTGWTYSVVEHIAGRVRSPYFLSVPWNSAGIDMASVTPSVPSSASRAAYTLSIGTVTDGASAAASLTNVTPGRQALNLTLPQGPAGPVGANGARGPTGARGSAGPDGATGPQGPTGPAGLDGATGGAGAAATIAVGTVTTLAAGESATVVNAGTSSAATFNFGIPQGAQGAAGTGGGGTGSYTLPAATSTTLGGVKIGANVTVSNGAISVADPVTSNANLTNGAGYLTTHQSLAGYARTTDLFSGSYTDLTNKPTIPAAVTSNGALANDAGYVTTDTTYADATDSAAGLMSATDKTKLDGLGGGGDYTLPAATSSTLGGVKIGDNVAVSNGTISVGAPVTSNLGLTNGAGYLTEHQSLADYPTISGATAIAVVSSLPASPDSNTIYLVTT